MRRSERPLMQLPYVMLIAFVLMFIGQILYHHSSRAQLEASYRALGKPMRAATYRGAAMGSEQLLGYLLAVRLQLHDNQAGQHFRYSLMDYGRLIDWLDQISDVSPGTEYPMLLAARIYSQTSDKARLRQLLEFIERRFDDDPQLHWRRMTEACLIAKHRLKDLELALRLAEKLAAQPADVKMPHWARDFRILLLGDLNELESAIAIIQAMLHSGSITDVDEQRFLRQKLLGFQQKLSETQQSLPN